MRDSVQLFPALRYRLFNCIFNPCILLPHAIFLITIWLMVSQAVPPQDTPTSSTNTAIITTISTVTATPMTTLISTTIEAAVTTDSYSPITTQHVENLINSFLDAKANDTAQVLSGVLQGYVTNIDSLVAGWNDSIHTQAYIWEQHYSSLQQYNKSIFSNLQTQSQVIDSSVQYLTSNGLLVTTGSTPGTLDGLKLNTSFLENIFDNVSASLHELRNGYLYYPTNVSLNSISRSQVKIWLGNDLSVQASQRELIKSLQKAVNSTGANTIVKRQEQITGKKMNAKQKAFKLSVILAATYIVGVILLMCLEYLSYRIEMAHFHQATEQLIIEAGESLRDLDDERYRLMAHRHIQEILLPYSHFTKHPKSCTVDEVVVSTVERMTKSEKTFKFRKLSVFIHWWLASHGVTMWIFLLTFAIEGHVLWTFLEPGENTSHALRKRDTLASTIDTQYDTVLPLCTTFESVVNAELYATVQNHFWNAQNGTVASVFDKVYEELNRTQENLLFSVMPKPTALEHIDFEFANFSSFLASRLSTYFPQTADTGYKNLHKRNSAESRASKITACRAVYYKIVYTLLGTIVYHHLCGFALAFRQTKNPVITRTQTGVQHRNQRKY
ncbi:LAME_0A02388g1_1 [Lachancea meyersii CBS 8951]|uniref:LAME_0A02388g1_1 n=1 Tax=Lachancea meyersii CBS 8951 TaxID=1266667 RepID=A0A1G4IMG0_9SACH|nr:LAME_0A02388g1_1 [Lachancea meyersii CBS 8951]